jgi:prepilin-type N-terminal cleavage/methylation domain-containing protein
MGHFKSGRSMSGFTLIEIMLVVGIIGLLCAIVIPEFLKARRRSQATVVLQELKKVQASIDTWALENNKRDTDVVAWNDIRDQLKENTVLYNRNGRDLLNHLFVFSSVGSGVKVDEITRVYFSGVNIDFTEFTQ